MDAFYIILIILAVAIIVILSVYLYVKRKGKHDILDIHDKHDKHVEIRHIYKAPTDAERDAIYKRRMGLL